MSAQIIEFPRMEQINLVETCERCGSADIEHTSVITPLAYCADCGHTWFELDDE